MLFDERFQRALVFGTDAENGALIARGFIEQADKMRNFFHARRAPRRPEIKDDPLAAKFRKLDSLAVQRLYTDIRRKRAIPLLHTYLVASQFSLDGSHFFVSLVIENPESDAEYHACD